MSQAAITVLGLSKRYRIAANTERAQGLLQAASRVALSPFHYLRQTLRPAAEHETLWALRDVSFEVARGEVLGVVGQNGSGKSTLLKILSRITGPTTGTAEIHGRVASLLEVGTGFHPELTGRENVYMNGAILGMRRTEIERKLDEIIAFAGDVVANMIDTPVKRYSSGMQVRLGFAVAAHLDPEVLLVDEVLSVGDASFRDRSMGRLRAASGEGRTVLFVSHNLDAVTALCSRAIWIDRGVLRAVGRPDQIVQQYLAACNPGETVGLSARPDRQGDGRMRFTAVEFRNALDGPVSATAVGQTVKVVLTYESSEPSLKNVSVNLVVREGAREMVRFWTPHQAFVFPVLPPRGQITCVVPRLPLAPGRYAVDVGSGLDEQLADWLTDAAQLEVIEGDFFGSGGRRANFATFLCDHRWENDGAP